MQRVILSKNDWLSHAKRFDCRLDVPTELASTRGDFVSKTIFKFTLKLKKMTKIKKKSAFKTWNTTCGEGRSGDRVLNRFEARPMENPFGFQTTSSVQYV